MDIVHTALWVSDLEATKRFYEEDLGLEMTREFTGDDGIVNYFVAGESETELQFKYDPDGDRSVDPGDFEHTAVTVADIDAIVQHVEEESAGRVVDGPIPFGDIRIAFAEDPDGWGLEFIEE